MPATRAVRLALKGAALAVWLGVQSVPSGIAASQWTVQVGGGATSPYEYGQYSDLGWGWNAFVGANCPIGRHFTFEPKLGFTQWEDPLALGFAAEVVSGSADLRGQVLSLGGGIRYTPAQQPVARAMPYVLLAPTLSYIRLRERNEFEATPPEQSGTSTYTSSTVVPGFEAGVGLIGPLSGSTRLDVGARFRYTPDIETRDLPSIASPIRGLRQVDLIVAIQFPM